MNHFIRDVKNMLNVKYLYSIVSLLLLCTSCQKALTYQTANEKLSNKIWYLEKRAAASYVFTYIGTPTFSFKLESTTNIYRDSDGIVGEYTVIEQPQDIRIQITSSTRVIESYKVTQLEKEHFVAEIVKNNDLQVLYFSSRP